MPTTGYRNELMYPGDISFGRLLLGIGPKTVKQSIKPTPTVPAVQPLPGQVLLGGKMYNIVSMKKSDAAALLEPATEAVTPPPTPPEAPGFVEAPAADPPAAPAVEVPAFTDAQDALILGLKALNKTWKEIGALLPDKDTEDLRDRYAELTTVKSEEKKAEDVTTEDGTEEPTEGKKGDKKKDKKNKKKGDKGETNHQEENGEEINGRSKKDKHGNEKHPRGILKPDEASSDQATAETFQGHPIIYITGDDGLSPRELLHLSSYHQILDERKWLQLSSKLFDETGKHIVPEALKEKFRNLSLL